MKSPADLPEWWFWELRFCDHVLFRMRHRDFNTTDLRLMLEDASDLIPAADPDRWIVLTKFQGNPWKVVLEPNLSDHIIIVITAFQVE